MNLHFVIFVSSARSAPHHAQGSQANAPSAPNQSVAPQQMIQPFKEATNATKIESGIENRRPRASKNAPTARTKRWVMERAAACCENVSGNFQIRMTATFTKTENVPYWNSPARLPQTQEYGLSSGKCPSAQLRATSANTGKIESS